MDEIRRYQSYEEAGSFLRNQMKKRIESITVGYIFPKSEDSIEYRNNEIIKAYSGIMSAALAHTGCPDEGDYIRWQYRGYESNVISISTVQRESDTAYEMYIQYDISYYTDLRQEEQVDAVLTDVMASLTLEGRSEYEKVRAIYEYITTHVSYEDSDSPQDCRFYTAHEALIHGHALCQGYANLFYRMALEAGLDARVITGTAVTRSGKTVRHGWNIVRIGNLYYNVDATWDAGREDGSYDFFLKGALDFERHARSNGREFTETYDADTDFTSVIFQKAYPMAKTAYR